MVKKLKSAYLKAKMLSKNIDKIIDDCKGATIVAATKNHQAFELKELLNIGINNFGENRTKEFLEKYEGKDLTNLDVIKNLEVEGITNEKN